MGHSGGNEGRFGKLKVNPVSSAGLSVVQKLAVEIVVQPDIFPGLDLKTRAAV